MKKAVLSVAILLTFATIALAAINLVGTRKHPNNSNKYRTTWAHPISTPSGIINSTGATAAYSVSQGCDTAKVKVGAITGTAIMNIAVQVADLYGPEYGASPVVDGIFTNTIGTPSAPYHQVDPADTDTYKFDITSQEYTVWRLNCLAGCDLTNSIGIAWGDCWMAGVGRE